MNSSFQSTTYNHTYQTQILGPSGLKIFAGEDLSTFYAMQRVETGRGCSKSSRRCGGSSKKKRNRGGNKWRRRKRNHLMSRPCRLTSIEDSSNSRSSNVSGTWRSPTSRLTSSRWNRNLIRRLSIDNWPLRRKSTISTMSLVMTSTPKTQYSEIYPANLPVQS